MESSDGVTSAAPLGIAPTQLARDGHEAQVAAFGAEPGSFLPPDGVGEHEIVVSTTLLDDENLAVGETVTTGGHDLTIAGAQDGSSYNHLPVVWMSLDAWHRLDTSTGADATVIASRTDGGLDAGTLDDRAGLSTTDVGGSLAAVGSYTAENGSLTLMRVLLLVVSALVVGAFFTV